MASRGTSDLDWKQDDGWTIPQYVQHLVEGEDIWGRVSVEWMGLVNPLTFVQYSEGDQLK